MTAHNKALECWWGDSCFSHLPSGFNASSCLYISYKFQESFPPFTSGIHSFSLSLYSVDPTTMGPALYERERIYYSFVKVVFCDGRFRFCEGLYFVGILVWESHTTSKCLLIKFETLNGVGFQLSLETLPVRVSNLLSLVI